MRKGVCCNECYKPLTEQELSVYPFQWQYSGDMYCIKHETREQFQQQPTEKEEETATNEEN